MMDDNNNKGPMSRGHLSGIDHASEMMGAKISRGEEVSNQAFSHSDPIPSVATGLVCAASNQATQHLSEMAGGGSIATAFTSSYDTETSGNVVNACMQVDSVEALMMSKGNDKGSSSNMELGNDSIDVSIDTINDLRKMKNRKTNIRKREKAKQQKVLLKSFLATSPAAGSATSVATEAASFVPTTLGSDSPASAERQNPTVNNTSTPKVKKSKSKVKAEGNAKGKRPLSTPETETEGKSKDPKRQKYSSVLAATLKARVRNESASEGLLTQSEYNYISSQIMHFMYEPAADGVQKFRPNFHGQGFKDGIFWINCADATSLTWLKDVIAHIQKGQANCSLRVTTVDEEPKLSRCVVVIPCFESANITPEQFFYRLRESNKGLDTRQWRVFKELYPPPKENKPREWVLILGIDHISMEFLKTLKYKPFYGMGHLFFSQKKEYQDSKEVKTGNV